MHHATNNPTNLMDNTSLSSSDHVLLGNGQGLSFSSIGFSKLSSAYKPHTSLRLHNLFLVPTITKNLISVSQFARDNSVYFEFHPTFCLLLGSFHDTLGTDGLYTFGNILSIPPAATTSRPTPCVNFVGCKRSKTSSLDNTATLSCIYYNLHFILSASILDLWGPAPVTSSCGYCYIHTCVDAFMSVIYLTAFTKYTWIFPLKLKSDTSLLKYNLVLNYKEFKPMVVENFTASPLCETWNTSLLYLPTYPSPKQLSQMETSSCGGNRSHSSCPSWPFACFLGSCLSHSHLINKMPTAVLDMKLQSSQGVWMCLLPSSQTLQHSQTLISLPRMHLCGIL
ncbi:hypothetical protein CR513_00754, partial [Mucuna pruriens]